MSALVSMLRCTDAVRAHVVRLYGLFWTTKAGRDISSIADGEKTVKEGAFGVFVVLTVVWRLWHRLLYRFLIRNGGHGIIAVSLAMIIERRGHKDAL